MIAARQWTASDVARGIGKNAIFGGVYAIDLLRADLESVVCPDVCAYLSIAEKAFVPVADTRKLG